MKPRQSVQEVIENTQSLEVGDVVHFTDYKYINHVGTVVEKQKHDNHTDWLIDSASDTPDSVLELWFDPEGGPINVQVSFEDQDTREVKYIAKV